MGSSSPRIEVKILKMRPKNPAGRWIWTRRVRKPPEKVEHVEPSIFLAELFFSRIGPNTVDGSEIRW